MVDWKAEDGDRVFASTAIDERWGTIVAGKDEGGAYRVRWDDALNGFQNLITDADIIRLHRGAGPSQMKGEDT